MNKFEAVVRRALATNGTATGEQRAALFQRLHSGLENITASRTQEYQTFMRTHLTQAIKLVESEYADSATKIRPFEIAEPIDKDPIAALNLDIDQPVSHDNMRPDPMPAPSIPVSKNQNRTRWLIALAALIVTSLLAFSVSTGLFSTDKISDPSMVNYSLGLKTWEGQFSSNHSKSVPINLKNPIGSVIDVEGKTVLNLNGTSALFSNERFLIDPNKKYELAVSLRSMPRSDGVHLRTITLAGLATFDKNDKLETLVPGTHRYGLISKPVFSKDNWKVYRTVFTGAEAASNSFRPGSKSARIALLLNLNKGTPRATQIEWITFKELP